jgi:Excreted virulence factor EspC, type VII ESX diderm
MGRPELVSVVPADLVRHAGRLDAAADALATGEAAGDAVRLGTEAYGRLCAMVPALVDGLQQMVVDALAAGSDSLRDTADRLRAAAAGYQQSDERSGRAVAATGGDQ